MLRYLSVDRRYRRWQRVRRTQNETSTWDAYTSKEGRTQRKAAAERARRRRDGDFSEATFLSYLSSDRAFRRCQQVDPSVTWEAHQQARRDRRQA